MQTPASPEFPNYNPPPKKRRSFARRFFVFTGVLLGVLLLAFVVIAAFFNKQITRQLIAEVNKSLKTELQVREVSLSLLSGFPDASVDFEGVSLRDALGGKLLTAEKLAFRFDLASLFGDRIKVHTLRISDGALRVVINRQGKSNTDIFKETKSAEPETESTLQLSLDHAEMNNVAVLYDNAPTQQTVELLVNQADAAGNFSAQQFNLSSTADFKVIRVDSDSSRYLAGQKVKYDAVLVVDLKKGLYQLQRVELNLGGNVFSVDGIAVSKPDYTDLNLKLQSQEGDISMIANLLPGEYYQYFSDFQSSGAYSCSGTVKGRLNKTERPSIGFQVALRDGKVSSDKLQSPLRNVSFSARYTARPDGSGEFEMADFKGDFGGQPFGFSLKVTDLNDPLVDFRCNGTLPLDAAYGLFDNEGVTAGDGFVRLKSLFVQGRYADMTSMGRIGKVTAGGEIQFDKAAITYNKVPVSIPSGAVRLQDNVFTVDSLLLLAGHSDFALHGSARNLLPVLFADSLNTADALLEFSGKLFMKTLDATELTGMFAVQETASDVGQPALDSLKTEKNALRKQNFDKLRGTFEASINFFQFGKIYGDHFKGQLAFDHNQLFLIGDMNAMSGSIHLEGNAHFELQPWMAWRFTARDLDLRLVMEQAENFGQEVVTDKNLRGRLSGRIAMWTYWDEKNELDMKRLKVFADVQGRDGELVGLKMLEDFSTFVHLEDLRNVKFTSMQNYIEVSNQKLYLPAMLIQSNALNLTLSGIQTFDNDIDYKLKINAGQVMLNRLKKHDRDLDPLPAEKGLFNLYYTVVGNLDKYDMKRGKKAVKAEFERSEERKKAISASLNAAFSSVMVLPGAAPVASTVIEEEYLDEIRGGEGGGN